MFGPEDVIGKERVAPKHTLLECISQSPGVSWNLNPLHPKEDGSNDKLLTLGLKK